MLSLQSELQHSMEKGLHCCLSPSIHFNRIKINDALTFHSIGIPGDKWKGWTSKVQCARFKIWWRDLLLKLSLPLIGFTNQWARIDWNEKLCLKLVNLCFIFYFLPLERQGNFDQWWRWHYVWTSKTCILDPYPKPPQRTSEFFGNLFIWKYFSKITLYSSRF